jgi:hypothetical protein
MSIVSPIIQRSLNVKQAMDGSSGTDSSFGYITELKIAEQAIPVGIETARDAKEKKNNKKAVVLLRYFVWEGERASPIAIGGIIHSDTKKALEKLISGTLSKHDVEFKFDVFHYSSDKAQEGYFEYVTSKDTALKAILANAGGKLAIQWGTETVADHDSWYDFAMELIPAPRQENVIHYQPAPTVNTPKHWGNQ